MVDRAAAEREWKQRKIESIEHPAINIADLTARSGTGWLEYANNRLVEEQVKIMHWRDGFEEFRDAWCEANLAFVVGSGVPGAIASCKLKLELQAIETLNKIYYTNVLEVVMGSDGIADFEPTEADIDKLVNSQQN